MAMSMDILIHLHIAKTGGTSLNSMIKHGFCREEIFETPLGTPGSLQQVPLGDYNHLNFSKIRYISGHVPFGIHELMPFERFKYITTIRNPINRITSFFFFQAEDQGRYDQTFEEYVTDSYDVQLHNYQTRVLCGLPDVETVGRDQHPPTTKINKVHLAQAKDNIEKFFLAAPIEHLVDLGLAVRRAYGWPMRRIQSERRNTGTLKPRPISPRLNNILRGLNFYDLALHEWVTSRFVTAPLYDRFMYALTNSALRSAGRIVPWGIKKRLAESWLYQK